MPVSAREGDNIVSRSTVMDWYDGPTVMEALDRFVPEALPGDLPLRLPVQDVYKFDERRIIAGRIESGRITVGDEILFSPSNKTARVKSLETWPARAAARQHQQREGHDGQAAELQHGAHPDERHAAPAERRAVSVRAVAEQRAEGFADDLCRRLPLASICAEYDPAQGVAAQRNLVRGEDQAEALLLPFTLQFSEGELVERQQQALVSRYFDFDRASVRVARPTFG